MTQPLCEKTEPPINGNDDEPPSSGSAQNISVETVVDLTIDCPLSATQIEAAVRIAARHRGFSCGSIGVRITSDATIREINSKHLQHDYATDVISFGYHAQPPEVEGELVVSLDTASQLASKIGWSVDMELLLYIVHGVLHICGMDDHEPEDRAEMRTAEKAVFERLGVDRMDQFGADRESVSQQEDG